MATFIGNDGIVKVGANAVAEVTSFSVTQSSDTADDTVMGDSWRTHKQGLKSWSGSLECRWDDTDSTGQEALTVGASVSLTLLPEGDTTGDYELSGTATVTEVTQTQNFENNIVSRNFSFLGNGALVVGTA